MPYIKEDRRIDIDPVLLELVEKLRQMGNVGGDFNYVISVLAGAFVHDKGTNYANMAEVIGTLECAKLEFYRRIVGPYEDKAIDRNGDVFLF